MTTEAKEPEFTQEMKDAVVAQTVKPSTRTFVDNAGRPVNPDEVRPVKPLELDTPEQLLQKARKEVADLKAKAEDLQQQFEGEQWSRARAEERAEAAEKQTLKQAKRIGEVAADRDAWERRAAALAALPTYDEAKAIEAERDRLRGEVAVKDKQIASLQKQLHTTAGDALGSVREANAAVQRAQERVESVQVTLERMQRARDQAEKDRDQTQAEKADLIKAAANWRARAEAAEKELVEIKKPKTPAPAVARAK